ncbi:sugar transferase [Campylobacter curvus]|uniref:sugar transferase n=1 Tax=Campylobacter curvus TaxID=200 RepID=UPI00147058B3|nr:sugar transferase [Campylobacter curvus]MBN7288362.1 sugar transferase [Campylobacter curvus]MDU6827433.1 sugar transferase [Campylobacter sp.]
MLVLGSKYEFNELDIIRLKTKFKRIDFVNFQDRCSREIRKELETLLEQNHYKYLVINTKVFVDPKMIKYLTLLQFRLQKKRIKIIVIEQFLEKFLEKCYVPDDEMDLRFLCSIRPYNGIELILKQTIDIIGAGLLFVVHFFMKFYVKYHIDEQSPGDIYFKQKRVGLHGVEFECIKYRSMRLDAEKDGAKFAIKNDERVFKFGAFIRKTRIDEIPQCINVLKGEMHLIGPRPERRYWINLFEKEIPHYHERHIVRPGITGWAQVNYPYGANSYDAKQKLMYDLYYIKHWSLWLEVKTMAKTILVIARKNGI